MEDPIIMIKNAITKLMKGIDPDTDVFYEEIKGTEEKHGLDEPETYYFVDIIPNGNEIFYGYGSVGRYCLPREKREQYRLFD